MTADEITVEQLERVIEVALRELDFEGVKAALTVMAVKDPERADTVRTVILAGLAIAKERNL